MSVLDLSRLQFALVTAYHYLFVPLSISLAALTAGLQTAWHRTGDERFRRQTLLVGKLLMATFAVGVVTGLVQEFQFGLSWSSFARFYGDVFGPTLAIEGMLAFFLEATFLGLWWFGWDRLSPRVHLTTIWIVAVGTLISAYVILAANAFMQNPVAYTIDESTGRARLGSFAELLTNEVVLIAFPHTIAGAFAGGGALLIAVGAWRAWGGSGGASEGASERKRSVVACTQRQESRSLDPTGGRLLARLGAWTTLVAGIATALTGDVLGKVMTEVQPMKMAAAEALYTTQTGAPFSLFAAGTPGGEPEVTVEVPGLLSFLATGSFGGTVQGIDDLQAQYVEAFGPGDYVPWVPVAYWTFRAMIGFGVLATAVAAWLLWRTRGGRDLRPELRPVTAGPAGRAGRLARAGDGLLLRALWAVPLLPAIAATAGWVFTETARQPWLVFGLFQTSDGVSPGLTAAEITASLVGFGLVYTVLAVVWLRLVVRITHTPPVPERDPDDAEQDEDADRDLLPTY